MSRTAVFEETNGLNRFGMELNGRVRGGIYFILLILGKVATVTALPEVVHNVTGLDCTNDLKKMDCHFDAQKCSEYNLTLLANDWVGEEHCIPKQFGSGQCRCSVYMILILGESHTVRLWRGVQEVESKIINVTDSMKPKAPEIKSVKEANGNFQVKWKTNMDDIISDSLTANVTYYKKGDTGKVHDLFKPTTIDGLAIYDIPGRNLEPSTTYVVSVKSYINWSGKFSDSSNEFVFTTSAPSNTLLYATIISLSAAAVLISSIACYIYSIKLKKEWWDKCPNPKLPSLPAHNQEFQFLKPEPPIISSACVDRLISDDNKSWTKGSLADMSSGTLEQSSGISTGSSCLSYANTEPADNLASIHDALSKAFPNISPISLLTTSLLTDTKKDHPHGVAANDVNSGSSGFENKTYTILIPSCSHQILTEGSEVQTQAGILCVSEYHPSEGDMVTCPDQQGPACPLLSFPPVISSFMLSDMSYQQCDVNSGELSNAEDSSLSSISSSTNTTASYEPVSTVEAMCDEVVSGASEPNEVIICDDNPCYGCSPAASLSCPLVDDDYQPFQTLVGQPGVFFPEQRSGEKEKHLDKYPVESFTKIPPVIPGFMNNVQGGQCLSELQRPFHALISANQPAPIITDSSYQSV